MTKRKYDLVVKVGEYTTSQGEVKGRFKNIGVVLEGENGPYILLDRTFNPAGVPEQKNKETVLISLYKPREQEGGGSSASPGGGAAAVAEDDIPF